MPDFDVVSLPEIDSVDTGETAPDFTRPLVTHEYWEDTALSALLDGGPVLLVFYPMNGGGKAHYLWSEIKLREWHDHLTTVGITIASPFDHARFIDELDLVEYRFFSDPANTVADSYGVAHDLDGMTGITEPRPAFFLINQEQTIDYAWYATEWPHTPPYDDIEHHLP